MAGVGTQLQALLDDVLRWSGEWDEQVWNVLVAGQPSGRWRDQPLPCRSRAVGKKVEVHYPQPLFRALSKQRDLWTVEHILAESLDAVVVCLASPGAYAQLGAFANHHALAGRVYVVSEGRHRNDPVLRAVMRHLAGRRSPRRIVWVEEDADGTSRAQVFEKACRQLLEGLDAIPRVRPVNRPLTERPYDLIGLQRFLLAAAYLLEAVREESLRAFLSERVNLPPADLAMVLRAAKDHLFVRGYLRRGDDQTLRISERGADYVLALVGDLPFARKRLDFLRFAGMNRIG